LEEILPKEKIEKVKEGGNYGISKTSFTSPV
jgi:hypothetical protein